MSTYRRMSRMPLFVAATIFMSTGLATEVRAGDVPASADAAYKEAESLMGGVPTFMKLYPQNAVAGAWAEVRDLEFSDQTALPPKVKALISLAVAAQIPCNYCVWADTQTAKQQGATDAEIAEAVAMAGLTRKWSTFFNGMQIDFEQFKKELGGE